MTLASLPTLSVQIAFNPTNIQSLTQTWTDVTTYVRDFQTRLGRQHFLDRVEAGTLTLGVSNRNGFFLNGSVNGTGYVIQPRLPIQVTATWAQTSSTSLTVGTGSKTFTIPIGLGASVGLSVTLANGSNTMTGVCTAYDNVITGSMTVNVTSTTGSGTFSSWSVAITYPVFYGVIDSVDEKIIDQLNSDLTIHATDLLKFLSLRYMASTTFWNQYATSTSATNWFRCDITQQATVTSAITPSVVYGAGYTDYTSTNNFAVTSPRQYVSVTGLTTYSGGDQNTTSLLQGAAVYAANGSSFTLYTGNSSGTAGGSGVATQTDTYDQIYSGGLANYNGAIVFNPNGAMVYSANGSIDLGNGSISPSGWLEIADVPSGTSGALDFWIQGQGTAGQQITTVLAGSTTNCQLWVSNDGKLQAVLKGISGGSITAASASGTQFTFTGTFTVGNITVGDYVRINGMTAAYNGDWKVISRTSTTLIVSNNSTPASISGRSGLATPVFRTRTTVNDGYWHHVGFCNDSGGYLNVYADGILTPIITSGGSSFNGWTTGNSLSPPYATIPLRIGASNSILGDSTSAASLSGLIDEVVISNNTNYVGSALLNELINRYVAGSLLSKGFPATSNQVLSGDRIAEVLCIAGFGTVAGGAVVLNSNIYFINDSATAWVNGLSTNGFTSVTPWFWDSPVTGSTALDLILQICDTDIGSFYQEPNGTFSFYNQNYYGTWSWTSSTSTGTWTPTSYSPTGDHVWTDDTSSSYHYDGPSLQVTRDDVDVWTTVKVYPQSGAEQIYENASNEPRWGYSTLTKSGTLHTALTLALSTANFLGNLFKTPLPRVGNVELRSETSNGANMTALLNTEFGDVVTFKRTSPNAAGAGVIPFSVVSSGSNTLSTSPSTFNVVSTAGASTVGGFYVTVSGTTYFASYTGITSTSFTGVTLASGSVVISTGTTVFLNPNMVVESISHDFQADPGTWHTSFILDPYPIRS